MNNNLENALRAAAESANAMSSALRNVAEAARELALENERLRSEVNYLNSQHVKDITFKQQLRGLLDEALG